MNNRNKIKIEKSLQIQFSHLRTLCTDMFTVQSNPRIFK